MKSYLEEALAELLPALNVNLSLVQISELASDLDVSIDCYNGMMSDSIPYHNPAEDKVKELSKRMESMHEDGVVKNFESRLDDHKREIKRLHLVIEDLQTKLRDA